MADSPNNQTDCADMQTSQQPDLCPVIAPGVSSLQMLSKSEFNKAIKMIVNQDPEIITKLFANPHDLVASHEYLRAYVISGNSEDFKRVTAQDEFSREVYKSAFYK